MRDRILQLLPVIDHDEGHCPPRHGVHEASSQTRHTGARNGKGELAPGFALGMSLPRTGLPRDSSSPGRKQATRDLGARSFPARTWPVLSRRLRRSQALARGNGPSTSAGDKGWVSFVPLVCASTVRPWPASRAVPGLADSLVLSPPGHGAPQGVQLTQQLIWLRQPRTRRRSHSNWNVWPLGLRQGGGTTKLYAYCLSASRATLAES